MRRWLERKKTIMKKLLIPLIVVLVGCSTFYHDQQQKGFSRFQEAFFSLPADEPFYKLVTIESVKVYIVSHREFFEWDRAAKVGSGVVGYATSGNEIWVFGRIVAGKIVLDQAVLGHELNHLLNFKNKNIADPDKLRMVIK